MDDLIEEEQILDRVRAICRTFDGMTEKVSHGEVSFFVPISAKATRQFAMMDTHHHGAAHISIWCAAPLGAQEALIDANPARFFRPPYFGPRGWLGIRLDNGPDWDELAGLLADAVDTVRSAKPYRAL